MQPFINPNYYNQYPYQQSYGNSGMQSNATRLVNNFNEIQVNEIPMDGTYKLFAKSDLSEVQAKAWMPNGTINTIEYSLKTAPTESNPQNVPQQDLDSLIQPLMDEIKALSDKVDKINNRGYGDKNTEKR